MRMCYVDVYILLFVYNNKMCCMMSSSTYIQSSNGYHYCYRTQYLCLVVKVLNEAVWMVVLLLIERNKEGEVVPVSVLLVSHVVCNPKYKAYVR